MSIEMGLIGVDADRMILRMDFEPIFDRMLSKIQFRLFHYGWSYRYCDIVYLLSKLKGEVAELEKELTVEEAIDAANMAAMIAYRLLKKEREKK